MALRIEIRRIGFAPATVQLPAGGDTALTIELVPVAQELSAAVIRESRLRTLERRGFYARMLDREKGVNTGYFITPEDLELRKPMLTTRALEGIPNVRVQRVPFSNCSSLLRCYMIAGPSGCPYTIYLDGARVTAMSGGNGTLRGDYLDELVPPNTIAGMEIYTRLTNAPAAYQSLNGTCGVLLIWTR
jgi:hypothetical protein